ncbi:hypothetical protein [uncultured Parolsenella sp.]|uniref:hypothetical protein n=1 Tax=uncultured Parolsenella sp. TaxID=2083008 RepID=UPI0025CCA272|nr:hypothetical protein [uncultured Parolsenella sp.]
MADYEDGFGHGICQTQEPYLLTENVEAVPVWTIWESGNRASALIAANAKRDGGGEMACLMSEALQHTKDPNGVASMKRLGRFLVSALKVTLGFFVWLFHAVFTYSLLHLLFSRVEQPFVGYSDFLETGVVNVVPAWQWLLDT